MLDKLNDDQRRHLAALFVSKGWSEVLKPDLIGQQVAATRALIYSKDREGDADLRALIRAVDRILKIETALFAPAPREQGQEEAPPATGSRYDM